MLVGDGLHPSAAMYARWLTTIEPQARAALRAP
jgi:lysophospholipase L1-like esterase